LRLGINRLAVATKLVVKMRTLRVTGTGSAFLTAGVADQVTCVNRVTGLRYDLAQVTVTCLGPVAEIDCDEIAVARRCGTSLPDHAGPRCIDGRSHRRSDVNARVELTSATDIPPTISRADRVVTLDRLTEVDHRSGVPS